MDYIIKKSLFGNKLVDMSGHSFKTDGKVKVKMLGDSTLVFVDKIRGIGAFPQPISNILFISSF